MPMPMITRPAIIQFRELAVAHRKAPMNSGITSCGPESASIDCYHIPAAQSRLLQTSARAFADGTKGTHAENAKLTRKKGDMQS